MTIEQMYTGCLAEAAYYIESNGEAAIIDPLRDPEPYIKKAEENGVQIKYIFETHFHADFVSGHLDLARRTGAKIVYGPTAKTNYDVHVAADNEKFIIGDIVIKALHTPGHTMESTTYLLLKADGTEHCIFTGDTLFIGDVGRPDLAIKTDLTKEDLAGILYDSLRNKIMTLPDDVIVYPAHGAGSACGKNMSSETYDRLGNQKQNNYALRADMTKEEFVKEVTTGILPPPVYFPQNARLNKEGYDAIDEVMERGNKALSIDAFKHELAEGATIIDTRNKAAFTAGFIPDSVFVGLEGNFATWVGTVIPNVETRVLLIAEQGKEEEAVKRLARVGFDNCAGYLEGGFEHWQSAGEPTDKVDQVTVNELAQKYSGDLPIADVRKPGEWEAQHVEGAENYPLNFMYEQPQKLDQSKTWYVHCKSGYRSLIAISLMKRNGYKHVVDVAGGFDAIQNTEMPTTAFVCPSTL